MSAAAAVETRAIDIVFPEASSSLPVVAFKVMIYDHFTGQALKTVTEMNLTLGVEGLIWADLTELVLDALGSPILDRDGHLVTTRERVQVWSVTEAKKGGRVVEGRG